MLTSSALMTPSRSMALFDHSSELCLYNSTSFEACMNYAVNVNGTP